MLEEFEKEENTMIYTVVVKNCQKNTPFFSPTKEIIRGRVGLTLKVTSSMIMKMLKSLLYVFK